MKKIVVILLTLILTMTNLGTVLADTISAPPASQISANPNYASVEKTFSVSNEAGTRGKPSITFTRAGISKSSSTSVTISATTESDITSLKIGGQMSVQRWINNAWSTYKTTSFWSYNTYRATSTKTITVPTGYYYRLYVTHIASNNDGTSSKTLITNSVLVN
jgi:hypothetical protein